MSDLTLTGIADCPKCDGVGCTIGSWPRGGSDCDECDGTGYLRAESEGNEECPWCGDMCPAVLAVDYPTDLINDDMGIVWGTETIVACSQCHERNGR
jgi:hypothetical protein